ncbi:MAG TPA: hypothetical protein PK821_07160 [Victivallales bacterium]|nr:hypothetical protein [Victivallales bacterium]
MAGCLTLKPKAGDAKASQDLLRSKVYLAHNLWYNSSLIIPVENYHNGKIISAGTEVEIIEYDNTKIVFMDNSGNVYTMIYREDRTMLPVEKYIPTLFVKKNPLEDFDSETIALIKEGRAVKGMDRNVVFASWGAPMRTRTPDMQNNNTWIYWADPEKYKRAIFKNGKLLEILE